MVTFNTHIIDQTVKDKFHPFIVKAVTPMTPIHYEKIELKSDHIIVDMFAQEHIGGWNCISKRLLIVGKLVNGDLKVVEVRPINNMNYRAPLPCSSSNKNCYTMKQCDWKHELPLADRKLVHPKEQGKPIEDISYEKRTDDLRYRNPECAFKR